jgi:GTP-binding protein
MADGVILLVDAQEGPKPQTKFVLQQAFRLGLKPILIINKIDKKYAEPAKILDKVNNLFLELATNEDQLNFSVFYAIGREGKVWDKLPEGDLTSGNSIPGDLKPLLEGIVNYVPSPVERIQQVVTPTKLRIQSGSESTLDSRLHGNDTQGDFIQQLNSAPFQMLITSLEYDSHLGRYLIGKINRGSIKTDQSIVVAIPEDDSTEPKILTRGKVKKIFVREGLNFTEVQSASAGEIVAIAGIDSTAIGATISDPNKVEALPKIKISNPSVRIKFEASTSTLVGKDGKFVTAKLLQQRLDREADTNISLEITKSDEGAYYIAG